MLRLFVRRDFLYDIRKIVAGNGQDRTCDDFDDDGRGGEYNSRPDNDIRAVRAVRNGCGGRGIRYGNRAVHIDDYGRVVPLPENKEIPSAIKYLKPQKKVIGEIYAVGVPAIVMQALMSFMTYGVNVILIRVSEEAVTAYGVYYKLQQFALFAAFGLNNAQIPIVAYNYGMGDKKRINDGIKYGYIYTVAIMAICTVIFECFADVIVNIFSLADET